MITIKKLSTSFVGVKYKLSLLFEKINMGWMDESNLEVQEKIIEKHNCKQDDYVCIELWFITHLNYASYSHYFQLPKTMIERKVCQIRSQS